MKADPTSHDLIQEAINTISLVDARRALFDLHPRLPLDPYTHKTHMPRQEMTDSDVRDCYELIRSIHHHHHEGRMGRRMVVAAGALAASPFVAGAGAWLLGYDYKVAGVVSLLGGLVLTLSAIGAGILTYNGIMLPQKQLFNQAKADYLSKCTELVDPQFVLATEDPKKLPQIEKRTASSAWWATPPFQVMGAMQVAGRTLSQMGSALVNTWNDLEDERHQNIDQIAATAAVAAWLMASGLRFFLTKGASPAPAL